MWTLLFLCSALVTHGAKAWTTWGYDVSETPSSGAPCGGYIYSSSGSFYSPSYPNNYPNNAFCTWYIRPGNRIIRLEFSNVKLECSHDNILVYDGRSSSSRLLGTHCSSNNTIFYSTGFYLTVRFSSDSSVTFSGFRADYKIVAGGSCLHNCNYQVGNCSCSSNCKYRGDCCPDYEDVCAASTTEPVTSGAQSSCQYNCGYHMGSCSCRSNCQPSCRYNCGSDLGSCSCRSSCQNYGNCCPDYYSHCGQTTDIPATAQPSCRYNCGYHMGSCSCSSSCQYYGNCCYDYHSYCSSTTPSYQTSQPSCRYNCGYHMGSCSCSSSCQYYGNCCYDYHSYCSSTTPSYQTSQPSCRYNCGYHMGSCSCINSCQYYGICCYDYHSYCSSTTPSYQTSQPSCRYNCGYHMGSCSCSSSCQYYGNCCYDYHSYCQSSTVSPTTDQPSCRYNCGYHMGSCSCSSSCRYNGNCCHDYHSYCAATTPEPCGGSLFGSGTFSSPNHPNYYHDNAYCVWHLRSTHDQRIFLAFTFLQLESCCSCDYISVYDGPSVGSRFLGKVCNNSLTTFYSSSNYMTVLFRSDSSVVGRGFSAEFLSSLTPNTGRVDCSSDNMNIVIERSYLNSLGYDGHSLYLNDEHCRPQVSSLQVVFSFPLNTCGNIRQFLHGRIMYTNFIRAYPSTSGEITRQSYLKMNVTCLMEQDSTSQIMYIVHNRINSTITGSGRYNTSMAFYTSSSFYDKVTDQEYKVALNQYLYVQVELRRRESTLQLFIDTCVASPSSFDFSTRAYYLVRDGCKVDSTYYPMSSNSLSVARFRFRAFQFLRTTDTVYIQCKVLICPTTDYNSRCRRGCSRRAARDLQSEHDSQTLVVGPIRLKESGKKEEGTEKQNEA